VRVVAGVGDGLDLLEQILHRFGRQDRAQLGQAVVDDVADGLVLTLDCEVEREMRRKENEY
jgi:hypothetical protein